MGKGSDCITEASTRDVKTVLETTRERTAKKKRSLGSSMLNSSSPTSQRYQKSPMADGQTLSMV
jgi:hypothetical protein